MRDDGGKARGDATEPDAPAGDAALFQLLGGFGLAVLLVVATLIVRGGAHGETARRGYRAADFPAVFGTDRSLEGLPTAAVGTASSAIVVAPIPPLNKDTYPCSQCHDNKDLTTNPTPRAELRDPHDAMVFGHKRIWCLDCHDANDRDKLHLANGKLIELTDPIPLCTQCHGVLARDWEQGIHGKRTGYWNGPKRILQCVECHDPHNPHFKDLEPLPPPVRPAHLDEPARPAAPAQPTKENGSR